MKSLLKNPIIILLLIISNAISCKKKNPVPEKTEEPWDITQHYIAGKIRFLNGPEIPFALILEQGKKGIFVYAALKTETAYSFEGDQFSTTINGEIFSCSIKKGKIEGISSGSRVFSISTAMLYKKQDPGRALTGKRFEGLLKTMDQAVLYANYYFQFETANAQSKYTSNPIPYDGTITPKNYSPVADGCMYNEQAKTFGVLLNDKLELQAKLGNNFVLFSGTRLTTLSGNHAAQNLAFINSFVKIK